MCPEKDDKKPTPQKPKYVGNADDSNQGFSFHGYL